MLGILFFWLLTVDSWIEIILKNNTDADGKVDVCEVDFV